MSENSKIDEPKSADYVDAEKRLRELLNASPESVELKIELARMLLRQEQHSEVQDMLSEINTLDSVPFEVLWLLGIAYERDKKFDEAIETLSRALEYNLETSLVHHKLGRIYDNHEYNGRNREVARRHLRYATTGDHAVPEAFIDRLRLESPERGNYLLRNGLKRFPNHERMNEFLCWRLYNAGDRHGCLQAIAAAGEAGVKTYDLSVLETLTRLKLNEGKEALLALDKLEPEDDSSRNTLNLLRAVCVLEAGDYGLAQQLLDQVMNDDFNNDVEFAAHFIAICCYIRQQLTSEGERLLAEIPISTKFYSPLVVWLGNGEMGFELYFKEALDGMAASATTAMAGSKARTFRGMYAWEQDLAEADAKRLREVRDDLNQGLDHWPYEPEIHSSLSGVLCLLREWVAAARHHWLGHLHLLEDEDYYPSLDKNMLEAICANKSQSAQLLVEVGSILSENMLYPDRFAKRCLAELIEFFH